MNKETGHYFHTHNFQEFFSKNMPAGLQSFVNNIDPGVFNVTGYSSS